MSKKILSNSELIDRQGRSAWEASGSKSMADKAYEKAIHILETHKPDPIDPKTAAVIRKIVEDAEVEYGVEA